MYLLFSSVHLFKCIRSNWLNQKDDNQTFVFPLFEDCTNLRNDKEWDKIKNVITVFNDEHNFTLQNRRNRKRKRFMEEMAVDEAITEPFHKVR